MFTKIPAVLLFLIFSLKSHANPPVFVPDFSGAPMPLSAGTAVLPLCSSPMDPLCLSQWSQQAMPLAVYPGPAGHSPNFQYFFPTLIPSEIATESPIGDKDWEFWRPSSSFRKKRRRRSRDREDKKAESATVQRVFYRSKSNSNQVRIVETNGRGEQTTLAKNDGLKSKEDIQEFVPVDENPVGDESWEVWTPDFQEEEPSVRQAIYVSRANPEKVKAVITSDTGQQTVQSGTVRMVAERDITVVKLDGSAKGLDGGGAKESVEGTTSQKSEDKKSDTVTIQPAQRVYRIAQDSHALPVTTKQVRAGCFVMDKPAETEAGFCFECVRNVGEDEPVLSALAENEGFWRGIRGFLEKVVLGSERKIQAQTVGQGSVEKICSPETSLKGIIKNFNETCPEPYTNNFDKFFKKTQCESCRKGIPVEIMMAMMSIESGGKCPIVGEINPRAETSAGLFQINAKVHQCQDAEGNLYQKNSEENIQCLKDPVNNLNKSVDILSNHYKQVNGKNPPSECKPWMEMSPSEQDKWRKGVSAYNGGPKWVNRAIHSANDPRTLKDTSFLLSKTGPYEGKDDSTWEDLRIYYFLEKLSPGNIISSGRRDSNTVSNLAHTEAVLGRNIQGSVPSMVEIWAQYKQVLLKKNAISCSSEK